jgi:hypothetical protein
MPLLHAAPWSRLLTAVGSGGARIGAAIETLRPTHYDGVAPDVHQRRCGLGAALRATLEAVGGGGGGFGSARLLLLLGGPPNYGDGKLASSRGPSEALAAAGRLDADVEEGSAPGGAAGGGGGEGAEDADRALLRPPRGARPYDELTTHYSPLTTHYSPLTTLTTHYSLLTTHGSLLTTHCSPLTAHYSLLTAHHSRLTTHYSLLTTHGSLLTMPGARLYVELADEAVAAGVAISLFAVAPPGGRAAELAALRPLPLRSGGVLNFYASAAEAPIP